MMEDEPGNPEDSSPTRIIEGVLSDLELDGLELVVASPEDGEKKEEINNIVVEEVPQADGHEENEQEFFNGDHEEGEEIDKAQPSTPPTIIASLSGPLLEAKFFSFIAPISSSSHHYAHFYL